MLSLIVGVFLSVLPERYRSRFASDANLGRGAVFSGFAQLLLCLGLLIFRYLIFGHQIMFGKGMETIGLAAMEKGGETAVMGLGPIMLFAYLLQPLSLLLIYFTLEGLVRGVAAAITGEVVPSLPLQVTAWVQGKAVERAKESAMGARIVDEVQLLPGPDYDLMIKSCRPKHWDHMLTISYQDRFYELAAEVEQKSPRRFVYLLRKTPSGKVIRGLYSYDPSEVLHQ